ncbi:MAG TPA: 3D domain-containing protein [Candidatus Moranbacteria bacterium]|nr:hypothetical protein [Candidatus Moranbacteria bacterium]HOF42593.1 3D domain-containing protein [Candidatus Moranbacteria bacterium]HPX94672.1 3D domain-containing protein [Candidatus Moranbacteria bacterium]HQB59832.1 3D domain-containing protein [Candidatus Moranbacteria bacterium]
MCIIRVVMTLLIALAVLPQMALASENNKTDTNTKSYFSKITSIFLFNKASAKEDVAKEEAKEPEQPEEVVKTEEEIENETILARWKEKQAKKWGNLPKEPFMVNASAYTASADECGNDKGITASGLKVKENRTIACPPEFPFGVKLDIEGMGTYVCEDRGGAIKGNKIDIYMLTKKEAFEFGRRNLMAQVVSE